MKKTNSEKSAEAIDVLLDAFDLIVEKSEHEVSEVGNTGIGVANDMMMVMKELMKAGKYNRDMSLLKSAAASSIQLAFVLLRVVYEARQGDCKVADSICKQGVDGIVGTETIKVERRDDNDDLRDLAR